MKTAVIYARYSSDSQSEQSIEGQLRICNDYAERNGILIVDTYIDRAMTGTNDLRPDFQRMLKDSAKKFWCCRIVKAMFGPPSLSLQTKGENIEVQPETLTITAKALPNGGPVKAKTGDTTDATVYGEWYETVHQFVTPT